MSEVMERTDRAHRRHEAVSEHLDVIRGIEHAVADNLKLLAPLDKAWQPTDYLPDLESVSWQDEVERFRQTAEAVSDQLLVVLEQREQRKAERSGIDQFQGFTHCDAAQMLQHVHAGTFVAEERVADAEDQGALHGGSTLNRPGPSRPGFARHGGSP